MTNFKSVLMVAVATISISACAQADQTTGYLGSRDDIIVNNSGAAVEAKAKEVVTTEIETVKDTAETAVVSEIKTVKDSAETVMVKPAEPVFEEARTVSKKISMDNSRGAVAPMKSVTTQKVSSSATSTSSARMSAPALPSGTQGDVPPNAKPGECYAKVLIPAVTETKTERFQVSEEQKVLDRIIPAQYQTTTERVKVKDARTFWKAGHGAITKKNEVTGEILCLVEEPAEYRTIEKRVLVSPEKPVYKTMPAKFDTVSKTNIIKSETWEWRRILCETNLSSAAIQQIQRGLTAKGYNLKVDGKLGNDTLRAINSYQLKHGLASRGITYETLSHMGVSLAGA